MILRIVNWGNLQHYKTRSAPWVKSYRRDVLPETDEGRRFLALSMAARGLLTCLERLAVETGNATLLDLGWLGWRLQSAEKLAPMLDELLAQQRIELAESAISPAITGASIGAIIAASRVSTSPSRSSSTGLKPAFSRSSGLGEGERADESKPEKQLRDTADSTPELLADTMRRIGIPQEPAA